MAVAKNIEGEYLNMDEALFSLVEVLGSMIADVWPSQGKAEGWWCFVAPDG